MLIRLEMSSLFPEIVQGCPIEKNLPKTDAENIDLIFELPNNSESNISNALEKP